MNSTEKSNLLGQAICCSGNKGKEVADMFLAGNKCAEAEFKDLALLVFAINALDCYQAPLEETTYEVVDTEPTLSEWSIIIPCSVYDTISNSGVSTGLTVDGNSQSILGNGTSTYGQLIVGLINDLGFTVEGGTCVDGNVILTIVAACDTESIVVNVTTEGIAPDGFDETYTATQIVPGNCSGSTLESSTATTTYENCFTEAEADNIADIITEICDICDCNNT